jgi:hypothetical protein
VRSAHHCCQHIASAWLCLSQTFSQLGGLQLDKDVRSIVAAAGELTTKPVRDKFARLTQVRHAAVLAALTLAAVRA